MFRFVSSPIFKSVGKNRSSFCSASRCASSTTMVILGPFLSKFSFNSCTKSATCIARFRFFLFAALVAVFATAAETNAKDVFTSIIPSSKVLLSHMLLLFLSSSHSFSFSSAFLLNSFSFAFIALARSFANIRRRLSSLKCGRSCSTMASNINFFSCASTQFTYAYANPNFFSSRSNISLRSMVFPTDGGPWTWTFGARQVFASRPKLPPSAARRKSMCFFLAGQRERREV
mmetsp:Transcript_7508/g.24828  ORF Transcript_7508/g.24828 Transcript_7508/m.24828 type:complete len:231 (+) Transcript_7508:1130-1822(+)